MKGVGFCVTPDGVYFSICDPYLVFRFALPQAKKFHPCGVQDLGIQPHEKLGEPGKRQDDASTLRPRLDDFTPAGVFYDIGNIKPSGICQKLRTTLHYLSPYGLGQRLTLLRY